MKQKYDSDEDAGIKKIRKIFSKSVNQS